jgi:hypothetical protein
MKRLPLPSLLLPLLLAGSALAQTPTDSPPPSENPKPALQISFEETAVAASGLTPGKQVIWFGVEHRIDADYSGEMAQKYAVGTVAADGTARLDLGHAPAPRSCSPPPTATGSPGRATSRGWGSGRGTRPTSSSTTAPF